MNRSIKILALATACVAFLHGAVADDDDKPNPAQATRTSPNADPLGTIVNVTPEQQQAIGIVVARPPAVKVPERIEALGLVLDPELLISELGDLTAAQAAEHATRTELERLRSLYRGGGAASLKMLEAAEADQAKTESQARVAAVRFSLRWGPLDMLPGVERQKILTGLSSGRGLLVRADMLGRQGASTVPRRALLGVDGVQVPGRVLGVLRQTSELQSVGFLIAVDNAPLGLSGGARLPVTLLSTQRNGRLVRRDAIFYDEKGAYVYLRLAGKPGNDVKFRAARVTLLFATDDGWLVDGIDDDDDVVMHGAGALWSLQEMHGEAEDDD
jgi:hypothetical protein